MITVRTSLTGTLILALAACAGGGSGAGSGTNAWTPSVSRAGWLSAAAKSGKALIYVSDYTGNAVEIYSTKGSNQSPIGKITDGIDGPEGSFVDTHGNLFVSNVLNQTVTMYPRGSTTYKLQYTGFAYPVNVAVGRDGTVYVADLVGEKVPEFPKGSTRTKRTISISYPQGVALDASNNLYVEYNTGAHGGGPGQVDKFKPKSIKGTSLGLPIVWGAGDAIDSSGDVVVADQGSPAAVYVFPPGSTKASLTITDGLEDPFRINFDKGDKHLYVADPAVSAVLVYAYPSGTLVNKITSGISSAYGVAISP